MLRVCRWRQQGVHVHENTNERGYTRLEIVLLEAFDVLHKRSTRTYSIYENSMSRQSWKKNTNLRRFYMYSMCHYPGEITQNLTGGIWSELMRCDYDYATQQQNLLQSRKRVTSGNAIDLLPLAWKTPSRNFYTRPFSGVQHSYLRLLEANEPKQVISGWEVLNLEKKSYHNWESLLCISWRVFPKTNPSCERWTQTSLCDSTNVLFEFFGGTWTIFHEIMACGFSREHTT